MNLDAVVTLPQDERNWLQDKHHQGIWINISNLSSKESQKRKAQRSTGKHWIHPMHKFTLIPISPPPPTATVVRKEIHSKRGASKGNSMQQVRLFN